MSSLPCHEQVSCSHPRIVGAACPWNATIGTLVVKRGYWRYSKGSKVLYKCEMDEGTNSTPCIGGMLLKSQCACTRPILLRLPMVMEGCFEMLLGK